MPRKPRANLAGLEALQAARAAAGAAYARAARAYVKAAVELNALDAACGNAVIGGQPVGRFARTPDILVHPDFLPPATASALTSLNIIGPAIQSQLETWLRSALNG